MTLGCARGDLEGAMPFRIVTGIVGQIVGQPREKEMSTTMI